MGVESILDKRSFTLAATPAKASPTVVFALTVSCFVNLALSLGVKVFQFLSFMPNGCTFFGFFMYPAVFIGIGSEVEVDSADSLVDIESRNAPVLVKLGFSTASIVLISSIDGPESFCTSAGSVGVSWG